jgi:D-serine deaminase-like pyridoxal phosphate-dependent protein
MHGNKLDRGKGRRFPVGTRLRILPNHACATGAQFAEYHVLDEDDGIVVWDRLHGW